MNIGKRKNPKGDRYNYFYDLRSGPGQRPSTGLFTYVKPKTKAEK